VKSIRPRRTDAQAEVDLGEGWNRYGHEFTIVSALLTDVSNGLVKQQGL
jgi:hypothetical protein